MKHKPLLFTLIAASFFLLGNLHAQLSFTITNPAGNYNITCTNTVVNLYATSNYTAAPVTYSWNVQPSGIVSPSVGITSYGFYTVTATAGTLTSSQSFYINGDFTAPAINFSAPNLTLSCATPSLEASFTTSSNGTLSLNDQSNNTFIGSSAGGFTISANYALPPTNTTVATVTITSTDINTGCPTKTIVTVYQNIYPPKAHISASSVALTCLNPTISLTNSSSTGIPANSIFPSFQPIMGLVWQGPLPQPSDSLSSSYMAYTPGVYTLVAQDPNNGCKSSTVITIGDNRVYPVIAVTNPYVLNCPNGVVMLAGPSLPGGQTSFSWATPPTATVAGQNTGTLTTNSTGDFTLTVKDDASQCASTAVFSVWGCVGLTSYNTGLENITAFPNPTGGDLALSFNNTALGDLDLKIRNNLGQLVYSRSGIVLPWKTNELSSLSPGIYYVELQNSQVHKSFKLLKE